MLDTHPCFIIPFSLCLIGHCSRRWSLGVQEQEIPDDDHRNTKFPDAVYDVEFPVDQEYLGGSQAGGPPFRSCCVCASLLKATLYPCVCTQILLLPLTLCS